MNKKILKVCIIGSTGHVGYVFNGMQEMDDISIVGVAPGSTGEKMDAVLEQAKKLGSPAIEYSDYRIMLDETKPDIVVVACHFGDHAKYVVEALRRNIHVFAEKPVATTSEDLDRIVEAYNENDVQLAAMFGIRYTSPFQTAWYKVQEGAIGKVRLMNAQKSYKLGTRGDHYKNRKDYGGTIPWVGSHAIDWLYWFSGEQFKTVYASHSSNYNKDHGDLEMSALCHFTFTNEVFGSVNIDYLRPGSAPSHADDRIRIAGTDGVIEVRNEKVYLINGEAEGIQEIPLVPEQQIFVDFVRQVRGEGKCIISAEDSFYITDACLKARLSADENRVVKF